MPEAYRIIYTRRAADELSEVFAYIERDSPDHAARLISRILDAIESLDLFPYRFATVRGVEELGEEIRSMAVRPYLVRYHVNQSARVVTILSVRHGARPPG
jgi:plasmid stabilization system protein ParE